MNRFLSGLKALVCASAALLCGGAWAAVKPVAVWDGNFKTTKCGVVTMDVLGNTVADDGSTITIKDGATQGVKFSWTTGCDGYTIIAKVRTLKTSSSRQVLVNGGANGNRTGVTWETDGTTKGIWNNTSWDDNRSSYVQKKGKLSAVEDSDTFYIAGRHKSSNGGVCGTYLFANTGSGWESVYEASGCRADGDKTVYTAVSLGGPITANASTFVAAAGMVIEKVAIFHAHLTQDEIAAYQFPAPIDYSRWSENIAVMTWQGTNGNSFHPGPWSQFDIATKTDSSTTWGGTSAIAGVPGQDSNVTPWTIFCSSTTASANHYIAPGYVLRLAADKGAVGTLNASFSTLALGGLIVEDCASGYSFDSGNDDRDTSLGNRDASSNVETWFEIRENFKIARKGALVLFGTLNFDIADGCTFDLNSTKSAQQLKFDTGKAGVLKMHGKGTLKVATLTAAGDVTLDFSDLAADRATSYIQGSLTVDDSTKINLPAGWAAGTAYTLCTGTLTAPQVPVHTTIKVGAETMAVVLTYNATNKTVSYVSDTSVFWTPNTANASAFDNGNLIWDAEDAWLEGSTPKSWSQATAETNVRIDAATVGGVKIVGQIAANEVIVECSDAATHAFEFHNHTLGVEKDPETDRDPTTDATWDCLTASAINLADYKGNLGLKVPIIGPINFSAGTHLVFRTGAAGGAASHAYAYNISGNTGAIEVAGDGKFQVPTTMYGIPFAPNATATIVYDNAETSITGALSGTGTIELQNGKTLALNPRWNQELHYVSAGTTANTLSWVGDGDKVLSSNDSKENPFVTVESGATLNIYGHDYAGWSGSIGDHSWFVNNGTIVFQRDGNNSRFWRDHIVLGNGSKVKIDTSSRHIALYGGAGTADKCQIMLESGTATIEAGVTNQGQTRQSLYFGNDGSGTYGTRGAGISVGEGATLTVSVPVAGGDTLTKWGAGTLVLSDVSSYTGTITLDGGMLTVPNTFDSSKISGVTAKIIGETTTYYKTLAHAIAAAGNENLDAITDIAADAVVPTGYRVKGGKVMTAADYYARWSNTENAAAIIDLKTTASFHDANFAVFYPATDTESSIFNGNQAATPPFGGLGNLNKPWNIFASKINGGNNSAYIAPGVALRFTGDVTGALMDATFAPLSFAGLIVEPGAIGFGYKSWRTDSNRGTELGAPNATTHSFIGEDFSIYRAMQGLTIKGTHVLEVASGKTLHVNDTTVDNHDYTAAGYKSVIDPGATLKLVGAGTLSVGTLDASSATIDLSAIGSTETVFIQGNITVDANTKISFPENWVAGTAMKLCSGTISGPATSSAVAIRVGDEIKLATLTYADGAVSYAESDDPSVWVVSSEGDTKEITGDTTLSTVILNGTGKITGAGAVTLGDVTVGANGKLVLGAGVTLKVSTISIPDYLILEAGAKISGTAVPNFAGQTIKIDGSTMEADHSYDLVEWSDFMYNQFSYGNPTIEIVGGCQYTYDVVPLVHKVAIRVHSAAEAARRPLRIWCVGDSITEGYNGGASCANYRVQLAGKLTLDGYNVQMVGFHQHRSFLPNGEWAPDKWAWHSGVSAQRVWTQTAGGGSNARAGYAEAIDAAMYQVGEADMVLIKLATNDIGQGDSADHIFEGLQEIVARVMKGMPMAKVALATTVWYNDNTGITPVSEKVRAWVATKPYGDRLVLADLNKALPSKLDSEGRLLFWTDNVHPNWNGHDTMSDVWKQAVKTAYPSASYEPAAPTGKTIAHGAKANVAPEYTKGFVLNRSLAIPEKASYTMDGTTRAPEYVMGTSSTGATKVGYYLELVRPATAFRPEELRYVWVDMEIPAGKTLDDMLVPTGATLQGVVDKLHVSSNMGSVTTVPADVDTVKGFLEFSPYTATANAVSGAGYPNKLWNAMDWNDTLPTSGAAGLGCMQVHRVFSAGEDNPLHNRNGGETIFAWNNWGEANAEGTAHENARAGEIGIGNFAQHYMTSTETNGQSDTRRRGQGSQINAAIPGAGVEIDNNHVSSDYTTTRFSPFGDTMNAKAYLVRNLEIWVYDPTLLPNVIVGSNEYSTLEAAITAAQEGDVIEIVNDISAETIALTKDVTITTFKGTDVTVAATFTGAHKLTKVGKGKLALTGSNAFNAVDIQDGAVEMTSASAIAAGATLDGSGRVIFNQVVPTAADNKTPRFTLQNTWTGTIEFKNVGTAEILDGADIIIFGKWANMNSAIAMNGVTSTMYSGRNYEDINFEFGTLEIMEGGWTSTTPQYGVSPLYKCNLIGDGPIEVHQAGGGTINFMGDCSGFTGRVIMGNDTARQVSFVKANGTKITSATAKKVTVEEGAVVGASGIWTASAGIVVNGTLLTSNGFAPDANTALTGSGRVVFNEWLPATNAKIVTEIKKAEFTGITEIRNYQHTADAHSIINLQNYASAAGIALNGVTMTAFTGNASYPDQTLACIEIMEGGWQTTSGTYGNSPLYTTALKGSGAITIRQGGAGTVNFIGDHTAFTGAIAMDATGKGVVLNKAGTAKVSATDRTMTVTTNLEGYELVCNEIGSVKEYRLMQTGGDLPEIVVPEGTTEVSMLPGQDVTVPESVTVEKIKVVYNGVDLAKAEDARPKYINVTISDEGKVELATTEAAKPEAVKIKMTLPKEGEGVGAKDKVSFTITDPIPGLFYSIVSANGPTDADFTTGDDSTGTQATGGESTTTSIDMPDAKVKYFRVRVKANK